MDEKLAIALAEMEPRLGLPNGFIVRLLNDDDWSFVIKMHALLESTVTVVLANLFHHDEVQNALAQVEMHHKIKMLSALNVFSSAERGALRALSTLRNDLVHNVEQVTFSFTEYLKNSDARKNFVQNFGFGWAEKVDVAGKTVTREILALGSPQFTMWLVVAYVVGYAHLELEKVELEKMKEDVKSEKLRGLENMFGALAGLASQALAPK
jgi:hypothetical protein